MDARMIRWARIFSVVSVLWLIPGLTWAEGTKVYKEVPSSEELVNILFKSQPDQKPGKKTRSIVIMDEPRKVASQPKSEKSAPQEAKAELSAPPAGQNSKSVAFPLRFDVNSEDLSDQSRSFLSVMASALKQKEDAVMVVEGHTDAAGPDEYNRRLSLKRAITVKNFLVQNGIPEWRLIPVGMGKAKPLPETDPYAEDNRRVEFREYR